jgi:hypothetical protein
VCRYIKEHPKVKTDSETVRIAVEGPYAQFSFGDRNQKSGKPVYENLDKANILL